jgi:hypothetical protein
MTLPARDEISVIAEVNPANIAVNGSTQQTDTGLPGVTAGTISVSDLPGYSAVRLHISTMTYDPLF